MRIGAAGAPGGVALAVAAAFFSSSQLAAGAPNVDRQAALTWSYPTFRPIEYAATGVLGAAWFGVFFYVQPRATPIWVGGVLFDDAVRDTVRLRSPEARDAARAGSDLAAIAAAALAVGVDALAVPLIRGNPAVAWQLLLIDAQSFALSGLLTTGTYDSSGRARPSYEECQRDPTFDPLCRSGATSSFWSGHTSGAFTAAGLSCAHHVYLQLYGNRTADALGCAGVVTLASATGVLRVLGDRHYATDVITGAAVGFAIGYGLPALLHYTAYRKEGLVISPAARGIGLSLSGGF